MLAAIEVRRRKPLASDLPLAFALPAGNAFYRIAPRARRDEGGEFSTRQPAFLEVSRRRKAIADAGRLVGPHHRFLLARELQRVAPAAAVAFVDLLPDLGADHRAEHGADDDRYRAVFLVGGARTDYAADRAAEHRADCSAITSALDDAVILVPLLAGVADVIGVVLLPPAMCRRPGRWIRRRGNGSESERHQRDDRKARRFHAASFL